MTGEEPLFELGWDDSGVTLICKRPECMVPFTAVRRHGEPPTTWKVWWQEYIPSPFTIEAAIAFRDEHLRSHDGGDEDPSGDPSTDS